MMGELLSIYWVAILAAILGAVLLSMIGSHIACRDESLQSLCIGKGASLGVLIGMVITSFFHVKEAYSQWVYIIVGVIVAYISARIGERITYRQTSSKTTAYLSIFVVLTGLSYWVTTLFPALETHMASSIFGDLVTLSDQEAMLQLFLTFFVLCFFLLRWRELSYDSLMFPLMGEQYVAYRSSVVQYRWVSLLYLSLCIYTFGLVFTLGALFLPTFLFRYLQRSSLSTHFILVASLGGCSTLLGFLLSLFWPSFPTVPSVLMLMLFLGILGRLIYSKYNSSYTETLCGENL